MYRNRDKDSGYSSSSDRLHGPSSGSSRSSRSHNGDRDDGYRDQQRGYHQGGYDRQDRQDHYHNQNRDYGNGGGGGGGYQRQQDYSYQQGRSRYDHNRQQQRGGGGGGFDREQYERAREERRRYETEEEEYEYLRQETRNTQNDSLESTRRALSKLNETEGIARSNMEKLYNQSEQLHGIDRRLDSASNHISASDAKTDHLKSLNKSFLLPAWGSKKVARREAEVARQRAEREQATEDTRAQHAQRRDRFQSDFDNYSRSQQRSDFYTTPQGVDRDDTEDEIDRNLGDISTGLGRLKMMAQGMNSELEAQTGVMGRISDKTDSAKQKIDRTQRKLNNIK